MIKRLTYFISVLMVPSITLAYYIYFITPTTSVSYNTGETVVLEWTTDAPGVYGSIALYQGMDINNLTLIQTIESNFYFTSGTQSYSWTIPSSVSTGSDYRIQFTIGAQSFNSSFFSINNTGSGASGHSLSFDGVDDYVDIGSSSDADLSTYTLMVWVKTNTFASYQGIVANGNGTWEPGHAYLLWIPETTYGTDNQYQKVFFSANGISGESVDNRHIFEDAYDLPLNEWHHITVSMNNEAKMVPFV